MVGELDAGNPHVQFDEGAQETCDSATRLCPTLPEPNEDDCNDQKNDDPEDRGFLVGT
jgi:hypothetical protein